MRKLLIASVACAAALGLAGAGLMPVSIVQAKTVAAKKLVVKKKLTRKKSRGRTAYLYTKSYYNDAAYGNSSTTRCLTPATKAMHATDAKQMEKDIAQSGQASSTAALDYRQKMDIIWAAMFQPYCGRGSSALSAAQHSFDKSFNHARAAYLKTIKK